MTKLDVHFAAPCGHVASIKFEALDLTMLSSSRSTGAVGYDVRIAAGSRSASHRTDPRSSPTGNAKRPTNCWIVVTQEANGGEGAVIERRHLGQVNVLNLQCLDPSVKFVNLCPQLLALRVVLTALESDCRFTSLLNQRSELDLDVLHMPF